jgi:hypothetical protein
MALAKLKALLRAAAARTIPDLWQAIADALRRFTPHECAIISRRRIRCNVIRNCSRAASDPIESRGSRIAVGVIQGVGRMEAGGHAESSIA